MKQLTLILTLSKSSLYLKKEGEQENSNEKMYREH
jgi:hypothetical protein